MGGGDTGVEQFGSQLLEHLCWQTVGDPVAVHPQVLCQDGNNQAPPVVMIPRCGGIGCQS